MNIGGIGISEFIRGMTGGVLMGLANLVPGISGGTMLLATGVYRSFVDSIAALSSMKINLRLILTLAAIGVPAALSIVLFAGLFRDLVLNYRWIMYSIFIGLTLGGVPVILSQVSALSKKLIAPVLFGIVVMILTVVIKPGDPAQAESMIALGIGGALGASAMVLPGISGGYILLVLGQYVTVLSGIDQFKIGLKTQDMEALMASLRICIPVGIGVLTGIVLVSHVIRFFFKRYEDGTYGVLLGLLVGAVFGLWPFQSPVAPKIGEVVRGKVLETPEMVAAVDPKYYAMEFFTPGAGQVIAAVLLVVFGFALTMGIDRFGKKLEK